MCVCEHQFSFIDVCKVSQRPDTPIVCKKCQRACKMDENDKKRYDFDRRVLLVLFYFMFIFLGALLDPYFPHANWDLLVALICPFALYLIVLVVYVRCRVQFVAK